MSLVVTLQRHTITRGAVVEVLPQMRIMLAIDGAAARLIGYVGTRLGAPINLITSLPSETVTVVTTQVAEQFASIGYSVDGGLFGSEYDDAGAINGGSL